MLDKYILRCIALGYHKELAWLKSILGIPYKSNKYYNKDNNTYTLEGEEFDLGKAPIVGPDTYITADINNKPKKVTVFRYLDNMIKIIGPFNGKIPYQDRQYTYSNIFKEYVVKDLIDGGEGKITIAEYKDYIKAIQFTQALAKLVVHSNTEKTITPPPGIKAYKKKLLKEAEDKYGKDVFKDELKMLAIDEKLKAYDADYMKDDPTMGIVTSKKIMNVSRKNKFISIGKPIALVEGEETGYIEESLSEGTPLDAGKIADINNAIRSGSASRGMETQQTGLIAKYLSGATRAFKIDKPDCGSKRGYTITLSEANKPYIVNIRFDTKGNLIKDLPVGSKVEMRDYMYCVSKGNNVCGKCVGVVASKVYNPAILTSITTGGKALSSSLSKFHAVVKSIVPIDKEDLFK